MPYLSSSSTHSCRPTRSQFMPHTLRVLSFFFAILRTRPLYPSDPTARSRRFRRSAQAEYNYVYLYIILVCRAEQSSVHTYA